jgi:hypothetical protein
MIKNIFVESVLVEILSFFSMSQLARIGNRAGSQHLLGQVLIALVCKH